MTTPFISCDWGTSSFRLRLVENDRILAAITSPYGIATTFESWRHSGLPETRRLQFYQTFLKEQIQLLQYKTRITLNALPLYISGMASSTLGMLELPYQHLPAKATELQTAYLEATSEFPHPTTIISGLRTENDVLRGEETLLLGALPETPETRALYILPGTHSKHIYLEDNKITNFKTFMTGEFFSLLTKHSVLSASLAEPIYPAPEAFKNGLRTGHGSHLLHAAFLTRTNHLFNIYSKEENYHFLSGLLIGAELASLPDDTEITLVSDGTLLSNYQHALGFFDYHNIRIVDATEAIIKAHQKLHA